VTGAGTGIGELGRRHDSELFAARAELAQ